MTKTRESGVSVRLEENKKRVWEYPSKNVGTPYGWWTGGIVPSRAPARGTNGPPPSAAEVRRSSCFCAGVSNLARRAVALEIPHPGNENYDRGAYFEARRPRTLVGRKYRNLKDQGHVPIVLPSGDTRDKPQPKGPKPKQPPPKRSKSPAPKRPEPRRPEPAVPLLTASTDALSEVLYPQRRGGAEIE